VRPAWPDEPIDLHGPTSASGTLDYFSEAVLGDRSHRTDYAGTEQDETIVEAVRGSRYAMGYFGFAYYVRNRDAVRALATAADGGACVRPSFESARTGRYVPLSRPLYVYVDRAALSRRVVREFLTYYLDRVTDDVVRDVGYVPVSERTARRNRERLRSAASDVA
jgi:phosphate transport system substrate-binding protein